MSAASTNGAAPSLQERLQEPETTAALHRLLDRLDALERSVDMLAQVADQAPAALAMMTDTVDDTYRRAAASGIDLEDRLQNALELAEKLTADRNVQALERLLDRLDQLERLVDLADQVPAALAMVTDTVDEAYRHAAESGVDPEARLRNAAALAEKLTAPQTVEVLSDLMDRMDQLERFVDLAEQAPGVFAMLVDTLDEAYRNASEAGVDLELMVRQGASAATRLSEAMRSDEFEALMRSGVLDPRALDVVGSAGDALAATQTQPSPQVGMLGLFRALRDPDVQRALGFLTQFAKYFGQSVRHPSATPARRAS